MFYDYIGIPSPSPLYNLVDQKRNFCWGSDSTKLSYVCKLDGNFFIPLYKAHYVCGSNKVFISKDHFATMCCYCRVTVVRKENEIFSNASIFQWEILS